MMHYYQGSKFKNGHPKFSKLFSLNSSSNISIDIKLCIAAYPTRLPISLINIMCHIFLQSIRGPLLHNPWGIWSTFQIHHCQCSISLPDAGVHVSIRISRLYLRVYVLCTYRRTDLRPLVWNVAVCTVCCSNNRNTHTHRCNVAVGCISLRHVATPVKQNQK